MKWFKRFFPLKTRLIFHAKTCVQNLLQPNLAFFHYRGHTRTYEVYLLSLSMRKLLASLAHQIIRIYFLVSPGTIETLTKVWNTTWNRLYKPHELEWLRASLWKMWNRSVRVRAWTFLLKEKAQNFTESWTVYASDHLL